MSNIYVDDSKVDKSAAQLAILRSNECVSFPEN